MSIQTAHAVGRLWKRLEDTRKLAELETLRKRVDQLDELVKVQCSTGNWDYNAYMLGMANGMLLAQGVMNGQETNFLQRPEQWLEDVPRDLSWSAIQG